MLVGVVLIIGLVWQPGAAAGSGASRPSSVTFVIGQASFTVDGQTQAMDAVPYIDSGRTYVPVRYLAAAVGVAPTNIEWAGDTQQVRLRLGPIRVQLQVGSETLQVNSAVIAMDVAPQLRDGRVYLPARWVAQAFGYTVSWDGANAAVLLTAIRTLRLATLSPLSGYIAVGADVRRGAALAVASYQDRFRAYGFDLELAPYDDQGKADVGAGQAALIDADPTVIGVVGTLMSSVALKAAPVLAGDQLVMVSPATTDPRLTSQGWTHYDQLPASDDRQGPEAARFASGLGVKSAYLLADSNGTYSTSLVRGFAKEAASAGLTVHNTVVVTARDADLDQKLADVVAAQPDLVFFAGLAHDAGPIFKGLRARGFTGKFMGGDGLDDPDLPRLAGDAATGVYMVEAIPPDDNPAPRQQPFVAAYRQQYDIRPTGYAMNSYDAASVILNATLQLLQADPGLVPARSDIAAAVRATKGFHGIAGDVTFDSHGENLAARMWLYQLSNGHYHAVPDLPATPSP